MMESGDIEEAGDVKKRLEDKGREKRKHNHGAQTMAPSWMGTVGNTEELIVSPGLAWARLTGTDSV